MGRSTDDGCAAVWAQQAGENELWYARFLAFRDMGRGRTIYQAYNGCAAHEGLQARNPSAAWYHKSRRMRWKERAEAWDEWRDSHEAPHPEEESVSPVYQPPAVAAPVDRAGMVTRLLNQVFQSLEAADLDGMDVAEARNKLPAIRMLFKDLLELHRIETAVNDDEDADTPAFTADELIAAQRELARWQDDHDLRASQAAEE